ncbi:MAG: AbrB/MazE/SpoVT family DNA-binding domain-containing protein [Thaumarchaeota archaeon]|nr:MAG: AbrB family transcriptional regulator [Nitrosopumilales archaeon]MCZ6583242.1 AbrB/MazE/SpoVT family DNA-binding domain-containing protein [Nitrososphaerota archaeon]GFN39551.1 MAG: AbrB family transcriptional regulator [Marine Group I thaumarchaeote]
MTGNNNQYNPTEMFKDWIQKSGQSQAEFVKAFGSLMMNQAGSTFDPMDTLKQMTKRATEAQANFMENVGAFQSKAMEKMFGFAQMMPNLPTWGAFKTSVGSNGRISIPEAEREALGIKEGNLVQVIVLPIEKKLKNQGVKK